jgi:hypothetical protein
MHDLGHRARHFLKYDVGFLYHTMPHFHGETYQDQLCRYTFDPLVSLGRMFVALSKPWAIVTKIVIIFFP